MLGALGERPTAARAAELEARIRRGGPAGVRAEPLALEFTCRHGDGATWAGLYAARRLDPLLARVGTAFGFALTRGEPKPSRRTLSEALVLPELGGVALSASRPRLLLLEALEKLDLILLVIGAVALAGGTLLALLLARGLTRPIVEMSRQAGEILHGEPKPVAPGGGRELVEFANAFNRAIFDLVQLRKRLAVTERIAAQREIARRVAHEIKKSARTHPRRHRDVAPPARARRRGLRRVLRRSHAHGARRGHAHQHDRDRIHAFRAPAAAASRTDGSRGSGAFGSSGCTAPRGRRWCSPATRVSSSLPIRDQMVQVLTNLVQNALDAVKSTNDPRVTVEVARGGASARPCA